MGPEGRDGPLNFWRKAMRHLAWAKDHPLLQGLDEATLAKTLCVVIHYDGVETVNPVAKRVNGVVDLLTV